MSVLEKVLALRPTNAASRLGQASAFPLLNPRDLIRASEGQAGTLVCVQVPSAVAVPALLRAAREEDAAIGLAAAYRPSHRDAPERFFEAVRAAADEADHRRPVFLQAGPLRLASADGRALEVVGGDVFRFVDAGFTLISVDASNLPISATKAIAELLRPAIERELSIELAPPRTGDGRPSARDVGRFLDGLAKEGLRPNLLRVSSKTVVPLAQPGAPEPEPDFRYLRELAEVARGHLCWLSLEDRGTPTRRLAAWAAAGVRKLDLGEPFARRAAAALPEELREGLTTRAGSSGLPLAELIAQLDDPLAALAESVRDRVEALTYADALDVLDAAGSRGSSTRAMTFLSEQAGY